MITFDKIVNKLLKKRGKVIFLSDIFEIVDPEKKPEHSKLVSKIVYRLKGENIVKTIRNGVYVVPAREDDKLNEIDLIEKYYFLLLKKFIQEFVGSDYFISGKKSLEIHLKNYSIPEKLVVVNRRINKRILIGNYQIIFKTVSLKNSNLFQKLSKLTKLVEIEGISFRISNLELALVESSIISDNSEGIDIELISKAIKKYGKFLDPKNFYAIGKLRYIMAFNRLKEISKSIDERLYQVFLDIIKKNGNLFVGEGLRKVV